MIAGILNFLGECTIAFIGATLIVMTMIVLKEWRS